MRGNSVIGMDKGYAHFTGNSTARIKRGIRWCSHSILVFVTSNSLFRSVRWQNPDGLHIVRIEPFNLISAWWFVTHDLRINRIKNCVVSAPWAVSLEHANIPFCHIHSACRYCCTMLVPCFTSSSSPSSSSSSSSSTTTTTRTTTTMMIMKTMATITTATKHGTTGHSQAKICV